MPKSRIPSPARSQGAPLTPRRHPSRGSRSVASPARSTASVRLSNIVDQFKENNKQSFALSPLQRTFLSDNTDIERPKRKSYWKKLYNSRDIIEVLDNEKPADPTNVLDVLDLEILSQEKKASQNYTLDLPESSDSESISSIVVPQRRLFTQKENVPQTKFGSVINTRDSTKQNKTLIEEKIPNAGPKNLFSQVKHSKPNFPSALLALSPDKTIANKTKEIGVEIEAPGKNLFGNRPGTKRKNMFADFIVSESEDDIPEIKPKKFAFPKSDFVEPGRCSSVNSRGTREPSPATSITTEMNLDDWKQLPSSTLVDHQIQMHLTTPGRRSTRLSKLSEAKESTNAETSRHSNKSITSKNVSKVKSPSQSNKSALNKSKSQKNVSLVKSDGKQNKSQEVNNEQNDDQEVDEERNDNPEVNEEQSRRQEVNKEQNESLKAEVEHKPNQITDEEHNGSQEIDLENNEDHEVDEKLNESNKVDENQDTNQEVDKEINESQKVDEELNASQEVEEQNESKEVHEELNEIQEDDAELIESQKTDEERNDSQEVDEQQNESNGVDENQDESQEVDEEFNKSQKVEKELNASQEVEEQNESQEVEKEQNESEVDDEQDVSQKVDKELDESQEAEELNESQQAKELNESQEGEEQNDSQEVEEQNESQHVDEDQNEEQDVSLEVDAEEDQNEEQDVSLEVDAEEDQNEEQDVSQEIDNQQDASLEIDEENNESQEIDEENNESQEIDEENNESQEIDEENNDSQEIDEENNESQEIDEENNESQEINEENNESQEVNEEQYESEKEEIENQDDIDEVNESQELEEDQMLGQEIEDSPINRNKEGDNNQNESLENIEYSVENDIEDQEIELEQKEGEVSHDTTGRNRQKHATNSPEAILKVITNDMDSFTAKGHNKSIRKTKSILKNFTIRSSMAPARESTGLDDGSNNSSAEGSGWDSHRTTRKTIRETFGRGFTPRKSLRALVMEKSAKRQTLINEANKQLKLPQANVTEIADNTEMEYDEVEPIESDHEMSRRTRQTTLEMYLQKIKKENMERKQKIAEQVTNSLKSKPVQDVLNFRVPSKSSIKRVGIKPQAAPKVKRKKSSIIAIENLPPELLDDMKYKPPKRFRPSNASWITNRLYKFLETKLEPKYDYKARVRAEKLVEVIYNFARNVRRLQVAPSHDIAELKREMARLDIVHTHFEFYNFFSDYLPLEIKVKVVPDIVNNIPLPSEGVFSPILV